MIRNELICFFDLGYDSICIVCALIPFTGNVCGLLDSAVYISTPPRPNTHNPMSHGIYRNDPIANPLNSQEPRLISLPTILPAHNRESRSTTIYPNQIGLHLATSNSLSRSSRPCFPASTFRHRFPPPAWKEGCTRSSPSIPRF